MRWTKLSGQQRPSIPLTCLSFYCGFWCRNETDGVYSSFHGGKLLFPKMKFAKWNVQNSSFLSWCWFSFLKWNLKRGKVQLHFFEHCFSWCAKYIFSSHSSSFFGPRFDRLAASQQQLHFWPQKPHAFLASQNAGVKNFAQTGQKSDGLCPPYSYPIFFRKRCS